MKIFAIYADIDLVYKPTWLDAFRIKYDKPYPYHIPLKQPCYVNEDQLGDLKQKVSIFFDKLHLPGKSVPVAFDQIVTDETDGSIMIVSETSTDLKAMQKNLVDLLHKYRHYYEPESETWEKNFHPHITIGRDLAPEQFQKARSEFDKEDLPRGVIKRVTLVAVNKVDPEEANRPENLTHYKLYKGKES